MTSAKSSILAQPISREAYLLYGNLIAADEALPFKFANMKTAKRFNNLCDVENLRPGSADLNLCVFRCSPIAGLPFEIKLLERHEHSTQVFVPMTGGARYLAVVCLGGEKPDLATLKAFVVGEAQGISYYPGVWHYPMTALDAPIDFACLVYEDGTAGDCEIVAFDQPIEISGA